MLKKLYVTTNIEKFKKVIKENTDENASADRRQRIIKKYSSEYSIEDEVFIFEGRKIHIDYLHTIDVLLEAKETYSSPKEAVGSAFFKVDLDHCLYLTDSNDVNLQRVYKTYKKEADDLAEKLWELNSEEFDNQLTHITATILSGAFHTVFGQFYGDWRKTLGEIK